MNKGELIKEVTKAVCGPKEAKQAVNAVLDAIMQSIRKGQNVTLPGFGAFKVIQRAARKGRNPQTGEPIKIKAAKALRFTAGKAFKALARGETKGRKAAGK